MAFLLGTEALFVLLKPEPEAHPVIRWKRTVRNEQVFISVISVGELVDAIEQLPASMRVARQQWRTRLREHLPHVFFGRILGVDQRAAQEWGAIRTVAAGRISTEDALIAATARVNGYGYVARGLPVYDELMVTVVDPYDAAVSEQAPC